MTINLADTRFSGPYSQFEFLEHRGGIWAVLDGRSLPPIAAGAAEDVREALDGHPARDEWTERCDRPCVAVFYSCRSSRRAQILEAVENAYDLTAVTPSGPRALPHRSDESGPPPVRTERPSRQDGDPSSEVRAVS